MSELSALAGSKGYGACDDERKGAALVRSRATKRAGTFGSSGSRLAERTIHLSPDKCISVRHSDFKYALKYVLPYKLLHNDFTDRFAGARSYCRNGLLIKAIIFHGRARLNIQQVIPGAVHGVAGDLRTAAALDQVVHNRDAVIGAPAAVYVPLAGI